MRQVAARTLRPKKIVPMETESVERQVKNERLTTVQEFKTLPEKVAKSTIFHKNFYPAELRETYKYHDRMKRIDLVFPYARLTESDETTLLLIDCPETEQDSEICWMKKPILDAAGYRYAVVEKDSNLYDVLKQVGAL